MILSPVYRDVLGLPFFCTKRIYPIHLRVTTRNVPGYNTFGCFILSTVTYTTSAAGMRREDRTGEHTIAKIGNRAVGQLVDMRDRSLPHGAIGESNRGVFWNDLDRGSEFFLVSRCFRDRKLRRRTCLHTYQNFCTFCQRENAAWSCWLCCFSWYRC